MRKLTPYLLPAFLLFSATKSLAEEVVFLDDLKLAKDQAAREGKLILVDFMASWCTPCKMMEEYTFNNAEVADCLRKNYVAVKVNIDDFDGFDLKQQYNVRLLPTLLFMDSKGRLLERREESMTPTKMMERLEANNRPKNKIAFAGASNGQKPAPVVNPLVPLSELHANRATYVPPAGPEANNPNKIILPADLVSDPYKKAKIAVNREEKSSRVGTGGKPGATASGNDAGSTMSLGTPARKSVIPKVGFTVQVGAFATKAGMGEYLDRVQPVSYTHLTLPTIYSV